MDATKQKQLEKYIEDSLRASDYSGLEDSVWSKIASQKQNKKSLFAIMFNSLWLKFAVIVLVAFGLTFGLLNNRRDLSQRIRDDQFSTTNETQTVSEQTKSPTNIEENNAEQVVADMLVENDYNNNDAYLLNELDQLLDVIDLEMEIVNPDEDLVDFEL